MKETFDPATLADTTNDNAIDKGMKGSLEFKKDYASCCLGGTKVKLGEWDNGNKYDFDIEMSFEGLFDNCDGVKKVSISGRGHDELLVIATMFKDISDIIKENL